MDINRYLDFAVLKPEMTQKEVREAILEGIDLEVNTICVRPCDNDMVVSMCKGTKTRAGSVLDFPYGHGGKEAKAALAEIYSKQGVEEIDMVMNYSLARSGEWDRLEDEISAVVKASHKYNVIVKVIFETSMLNIEQIKKATEVCISANADFVKTSTGFHGQGATIEAVKAMLEAAAGRIKVKASGGIRDKAQAKMFIDMGVSRLGVGYSSAKAILTGEKINDNDASVY
ncbi:MAG TPA: deoxyribose-phosphate aldolase [Clostridiaceae bacterium]|jgi:deoxyribose-phosphate aldolase|nr:deoxyribose-phosphate aldolase [Clostridiaceae bacterium]